MFGLMTTDTPTVGAYVGGCCRRLGKCAEKWISSVLCRTGSVVFVVMCVTLGSCTHKKNAVTGVHLM